MCPACLLNEVDRDGSSGRDTSLDLRGTRIDRYLLQEPLGEGGMGTVWRARQDEPIEREVALKVIKPGMDTRAVIERFEAERKVLTSLSHPNIASVLDAGVTERGGPYFVMELVDGTSITAYCERENLELKARLNLFTTVCYAVAHAHEKGVIHRDLKPSNILVSERQGSGGPQIRVIDFGVAKATESPGSDQTLLTLAGQIVGTPGYMSPEQASAETADVRSDVYSLGVLLYEMLTGEPPFDSERLRSAALAEVQRIICEEDPPKPSTRVTETKKKKKSTAAQAGTRLRGDLDWIVMKALEKDRRRRYSGPLALAEDVGRYFQNEPVSAAAPSVVYRFGKFARRYRGRLAVAMTVFGAVVGVAIISILSSVRLKRALGQTEQERQRTVDALAESFFLRGIQHYDKGDEVNLALAHWAKALRHDPEFHPAASRIVSVLLQDVIPRPEHVPVEGPTTLRSIALDSKRNLLAAASLRGDVQLWNWQEKRLLQEWRVGQRVRQLEFDPTGELLVALSMPLEETEAWDAVHVHFLDVRTGKERWPMVTFPERSRTSITFSADGRLMAAHGRVFSMESGKVIFAPRPAEIDEHVRKFGILGRISPDGRFLLLGSYSGSVFIFDIARGTLADERRFEFRAVLDADWSVDSRRYAVAVSDEIRVLDPQSPEDSGLRLAIDSPPTKLAFDPTGTRLFVGSEDGLLTGWSIEGGELAAISMRHGGEIREFSFNHDGSQIVSGARNGEVRVWDAKDGKPVCGAIQVNDLRSLSFGEKGQYVTGARQGTINSWRVPRRPAEPLKVPFARSGKNFAVSPNAQQIAYSRGNNITDEVIVLDALSGEQRFRLQAHRKGVRAINFHPDSQVFATGSMDGTVRVWDAETGESVHPTLQHPSGVVALQYSPSGKRLAAACREGEILVWNVPMGNEAPTVLRSGATLESVAQLQFDATEERLCVGNWGLRDFAWNLADQSVLARWPESGVGVWPCFLKDSRLVALGGRSRMRMWDSARGGLFQDRTLTHGDTVTSTDWSSGESIVVTASHDQFVRVWDFENGRLMGDPFELSGYRVLARFDQGSDRVATASDGGQANIWDTLRGVKLGTTRINTSHRDPPVQAEFVAAGNRLFVVGNRLFSLWDIPPPYSTPIPDWLADLAESVGGIRLRQLDAEGGTRTVTEETPWDDRFRLWASLRDRQESDPYTKIAQWFLSDGETRPSPYRIERQGPETID